MFKLQIVLLLIVNCGQINSALLTNNTVPAIFNIMLPYLKVHRLQGKLIWFFYCYPVIV